MMGRSPDISVRPSGAHIVSWRSVSTLLLTSMVIMAVFIFAMGVMAYSQVKAIQSIVTDTLARSEGRYLTSRIRIESLLLSDLTKEYILQTEPQGKVRVKVSFDESSRRIEELFVQALKMGAAADHDTIRNVMEKGVRPFVAQAGILMGEFDQEGKCGPRTQSALIKLVSLRGPMLDYVQSMEDLETQRLDRARKRARTVASNALWIIFAGGGIILIMAILVAIINLRRILIPLADIQRAVESVAKGKFNAPIRIRRDDEFGELARVFNHMADQLQSLIEGLERRVADRTEQLSDSNNKLQQEVVVRKEAEESLKKAFDDLKKVQAQLIQSEKMAGIGVLAAGVAHEINNPLGFIKSNLTILNKYLETYDQLVTIILAHKDVLLYDDVSKFAEEHKFFYIQEDARALLQETLDGVTRIASIVTELKTFSHDASHENKMGPLSVEAVIESILGIVHNQIKYKAELVKEYGATKPVYGSDLRLGQVFINLVMNAAQAIDKSGKIIIRSFTEGDFTIVEVEDTGSGIPPEHRDKIFDAFFTTKPVGSGTGLGLSVSYEIIQQHNGSISFESELGKGSIFRVKLPIFRP